jgi:hypothetical protein
VAGTRGHRLKVGQLDDEDAREAVRRRLERRGELPQAGPPSTWSLTRHTLVTGRVVRSIESRTERPEKEPGDFDLSDRPLYDVLGDYRLDPPGDPSKPMTLRLVKRGTEAVDPCPRCDGGKVRCPRCSGRKTVRCEPRTDCEVCGGVDSCLNCRAGDGDTGSESGPGAGRAVSVRAEKRLTCVNCKEPGVACRSCLGAGEVDCLECEGKGRRDCPRCERAGTVSHDDCRGTGALTTWVGGTISHDPDTKPLRWPPHGVSWWARNIARRHGSWRTAVLDGRAGIASVGELDDEAAKGLAPSLAKADGEVALEATLEVLPLVRVDVPLLPHRVLYAHPAQGAHPGATVYEVFAVPSRQRTAQFAAAALVALAVLASLWWFLP